MDETNFLADTHLLLSLLATLPHLMGKPERHHQRNCANAFLPPNLRISSCRTGQKPPQASVTTLFVELLPLFSNSGLFQQHFK